jgi:flagellar export protein FliJ
MTTFRFSLQKVLDWRKTELELAEMRFKQAMTALAELDRARAEWEAEGIKAELQVREWSPLEGRYLAALGNFRSHVKRREKEIALRRVECQRDVETRRKAMLEARRRCRLLERLKERRHAEWQAGFDRELEETAAEAYLARWTQCRP